MLQVSLVGGTLALDDLLLPLVSRLYTAKFLGTLPVVVVHCDTDAPDLEQVVQILALIH